ncbi:hypothetical protein BY458DRAFT_576842, partial [Sporodiniella umbellata]
SLGYGEVKPTARENGHDLVCQDLVKTTTFCKNTVLVSFTRDNRNGTALHFHSYSSAFWRPLLITLYLETTDSEFSTDLIRCKTKDQTCTQPYACIKI